MRLIDFFDKGIEIAPDRPFLIDDVVQCTYRETQALSHRIANAFRRDGIAPGTKAAVYAQNATRAFECVIGILRRLRVGSGERAQHTVEDSAHALTIPTPKSCSMRRRYGRVSTG